MHPTNLKDLATTLKEEIKAGNSIDFLVEHLDVSAIPSLCIDCFSEDSVLAVFAALKQVQQSFDAKLRMNDGLSEGGISEHCAQIKRVFVKHVTKEWLK